MNTRDENPEQSENFKMKFSTPSPGELLKKQRQKLGLKTKDVAQHLLLSKSQVIAIEESDYEKLTGATYILGYWRSYANLIDLDIADSVAVHKTALHSKNSNIVLEANHQRAHGAQEKSRKKAGILFFLLSVLFLGYVWYLSAPSDSSSNNWLDRLIKNTANTADVGTTQQQQTKLGSQEQILEFSNNQKAAAESVLLDSLPEPNFSEERSSAETSFENTDSLPIQDDVVEGVEYHHSDVNAMTSQSTILPFENSVPVAEIEVVSDAISGQAESQDFVQFSDASDIVHFKLSKPTWLDVRDNTGDKLVYRTVKSGEILSLKGNPPFAVFIGAVNGVEVRYRGQIVNYTPHNSDLFSRFLLGVREEVDYEPLD